MKPNSLLFSALFIIAALSFALLSPVDATPQKKKKKQSQETPPAATQPTDQSQPAQSQPEQSAAPNAAAAQPTGEQDQQREAWRINVEPYAMLGSGRPGKEISDFDKPDGVAFTPQGWLLATDAHNRR